MLWARRLPVLLFFGICSSAGRGEEGLRRPRPVECGSLSTPSSHLVSIAQPTQLKHKFGLIFHRVGLCFPSPHRCRHTRKRPSAQKGITHTVSGKWDMRWHLPFCSRAPDSTIISGQEELVSKNFDYTMMAMAGVGVLDKAPKDSSFNPCRSPQIVDLFVGVESLWR